MIKRIFFSTKKQKCETRASFCLLNSETRASLSETFSLFLQTSNSTPFRKFICIYNRLDHSTFFQSFQFHNQRKIIINTTKQCQKQQLLLPNKLHATVWPPSQLTCFPPTPPPPPRSSAPTASPPPPDPLRRWTWRVLSPSSTRGPARSTRSKSPQMALSEPLTSRRYCWCCFSSSFSDFLK